ncbi:MAG: hypothetical protein JXB13_15300 [Phycisphaerae bacterium]|nr:hypothetical protein [Phycisphaerae bacterium]
MAFQRVYSHKKVNAQITVESGLLKWKYTLILNGIPVERREGYHSMEDVLNLRTGAVTSVGVNHEALGHYTIRFQRNDASIDGKDWQ